MHFLLGLLIITLPLNLFYKLSIANSFVKGLQVDYLIHKLYLPDLLLITILITWLGTILWKNKSQLKISALVNQIKSLTSNQNFLSVLLLITALVIRQAMSERPTVAFFFLFNLGLVGLFALFLSKFQLLLKSKFVTLAVATGFLLQFALGLYQFTAQQPLLPYQYLGEPSFAPYYRLSRNIFAGQEKILAYGSTAHPNILASTIVIFFLILASRLNPFEKTRLIRKNQVLLGIFFIITLVTLYITQARSAVFTLILGCLFLWGKQINFNLSAKTQKIGLLLILVMVPVLLAVMSQTHTYQPSIARRHLLNSAAAKMILDQPFLGQGLNHFTVYLEEFSSSPEAVRFLQPAHHVGLLFIAETGLLGLLTLYFLWRMINKKTQQNLITTLLILSPVLATDHFFYSLQSGRLLLVFFVLVFMVKRDIRN
jgi:hypothetical protein